MRLPRNVKMLRGPVDSAAVAGTVVLLWVATLLHSSLVLPAGMRIQLPEAAGQWGEVIPQWTVAVDAAGRLLFEQQLLAETNFAARLEREVAQGRTNHALLVLADRRVPAETLARLMNLARTAGVRDVVLATSPRAGTAVSEPMPLSGVLAPAP